VYAKRRVETKFQTKNIDAEYFNDTVWRNFAHWVIFTGQLRNPWVPRNPGWKSLQ